MKLISLNPWEIVVVLAVLLYVIQTGLIYLGTLRLNYPRKKRTPKISVLVAACNEERTLRACVASLLDLDYPHEALEIVLINDRSTDATFAIMKEFEAKSEQVSVVDLTASIPGLSGKANAIAQGIEHSTGELVLVTDADCQLPTGWARAHAAYYEEKVGLVGGFTLLDQKNDRTSRFGKVQSLDWAYLLSIGSGAIGLGTPLSVLGNNFSFRKKAYDQVGGYREMGFSIIEDFALMKSLVKRTGWKVLYPIDAEMVVFSHPMPTFADFHHQRKRWSAGGKEVGLYGKFLMLVAFLVHVLLPISFFFAPLLVTLGGFTAVLTSDFILLRRTTALAKRTDLLRYFPLWESFYFLYTIFFAPVLLFPTTVTWKQVSYSWKANLKLKHMRRVETKV